MGSDGSVVGVAARQIADAMPDAIRWLHVVAEGGSRLAGPLGDWDGRRWDWAVGDVLARRGTAVAELALGRRRSEGGAFIRPAPVPVPVPVPVPDSWVGWIAEDDVLVAWVPEVWLARADRGICVNPEQCIAWLHRDSCAGLADALAAHDVEVPPREHLRARGLYVD